MGLYWCQRLNEDGGEDSLPSVLASAVNLGVRRRPLGSGVALGVWSRRERCSYCVCALSMWRSAIDPAPAVKAGARIERRVANSMLLASGVLRETVSRHKELSRCRRCRFDVQMGARRVEVPRRRCSRRLPRRRRVPARDWGSSVP